METRIYIGVVFILGFTSIGLARGDIILPKTVRHLIYLKHKIDPPEDLFNPIVLDNFKFNEKGFSRTYELKPKYHDIYAFGITTDMKELRSKYRFKGKIKLEFFSKGNLILEKIASEIDAMWYLNNDTDWFRKLAFLYFEIPLLGKYKKDISVKITVLEPDAQLNDKPALRLFIAVSGKP